MTKNYIIIWNEDWADEFDTFGFNIVTEDDLNTVLKRLKHMRDIDHDKYMDHYYEFGFGSNESHEWTFEFVHEIISNAVELKEEEFNVLISVFGRRDRGIEFFDQVMDWTRDYE